MAGSVHEEAIDLHLPLLEAIGSAASGPWPLLRPLGRSETRTFRAIVLQNNYLRVTLVPDLGGRIAAIHDRRTGIDVLRPPAELEMVEGGPRGVDLPFGIEVTLDGGPRLNALGPVRAAMDEDADEAAVWLAESVSGNGLSWHLRVSLPEERAAIRLELRVTNRTTDTILYNGGFSASRAERRGDLYLLGEGGFLLREGDSPLDGGLARFSEEKRLGGRRVDTVEAELVVFSGIGTPTGGGAGGVFRWENGQLALQASESVRGVKAILHTADGQTLEAPLTLDPHAPIEMDVAGIEPAAFVVMDEDRRLLMEWRANPPQEPEGFSALENLPDRALRQLELRSAVDVPATVERARRAMVAESYEEAAELFERFLLTHGDDPLAWWGLAAARRLAGDEGERPELMNARWLAPLEPMLRAEAFLSTPVDASADPSGLLDPLDETPDAFVEVAAILIDHGMWIDAARWIDEALRRHDLSVLHLLTAYAHLEGSGLKMEAERHFRLYQRNQGSPYPWRTVEIRVLHRLQENFV